MAETIAGFELPEGVSITDLEAWPSFAEWYGDEYGAEADATIPACRGSFEAYLAGAYWQAERKVAENQNTNSGDGNKNPQGLRSKTVAAETADLVSGEDAQRPSLDSEMYAIALCVEGLEAVKGNPHSLNRVLHFLTSRYLEGLVARRNAIDAEIQVLQKKIAREKYATDTDVMVDVIGDDGKPSFSGEWGSVEVQAAWRSGCRVGKQSAAPEQGAEIG